MNPLMLAYTSQKRGSEKAAARAKAGSTGLSPNWWLNDWNNQANAPLLRSQANTYAAPTSPFATEAFAQAADPLAMFRPKPGEPATKRLARTPGMLENVMARIDSDPRLRLSPQDRDLALSSFWLRQRLPDGAVPNAMTPGGMRGPISEADVEDVLSKLRDPQKRAALEMQVEGIRRERYRMQLPFTADDLRDATAKGLTFVRGRDGMIELSDALAMWNRAGMAPVEARDIGDEGRAIMQAQTVAPLVMGSFGTTGDAGFGRFKEMARQEASKQSRRKWSWPFEVLGAVVNEAIRPGHMAEVAAVSRKQLESKLGRPLTTREERVLAEDIRWGQEQMGQFVSALATSGHSESAQVLDDVVNFFPQVGDAAEVWADPKSSESERQWALLEAGLAIGIGTQLGREGLGKALRAPGKLYIDQPGILGKGVPKAGEDAWDAYLNSYKTHQESEGLFRPAARERATGGDVGARPRWDVKPDPNYDPGEPVDLVGIAKSRDPEMLRRRKMLAELIVDPDDPRLDPFDDRFDEAFRDGVAASLGVEPNEVVRAVEDRQRSLYEENFVREIERSEMPDADLSGSETKYFIPWYLNKKTQTWMPIKSRPRKFLSYRGVDAAMMGGALSRIIEIAEWMDDGTTVYSTSAADFIGRSKTARNKGVYARSGSTNTPEGAMRISEIITHDGGGIGNLNDLDTDNSRVWVPAEAVRIYQKEVRERLKELSRDVEELAAAEMGFTYDEYRAARDHYNEELERLRSEEDSGSGFDAEEGYETAADDAGAVDRDPEPGVAARAEGGQEEVARHEVTDRASFETALRQQRGLGEGQADAILAVTDARAKGWARETGGQIDDWYASRIRAVTSEAPVGFPDAGRSNSGAVSFQNDGSAVIHAFETADVTTFAHEVGHIFERDLPDHEVALLRQIRKKAAGDAWGEADREWFADSFTEYLRTGKTAHEGLKSVFERFKAWMAEIYRSIRNRPDVKVSDDLRGLFDRMLDEEGFGQPGELRDRVIGADGQKATAAPRRVQIDGEWLQLDPAAEKTYDRLEADYRAEKRRLQAVVDQERDLGRREIAEIDLRQLEQEWQVQRRRFASEVVNRELDRQHVYGSADEGDGEDVAFQSDDRKGKLRGIHNTRMAGLRAAIEMGGIPQPSLAITRDGVEFKDFGNISLVAKKSVFDPADDYRNRIFDGDAYSQRQPRPQYKVDARGLDERLRSLGDKYQTSGHFSPYSLRSYDGNWDRAVDELRADERVKAAFLESQGVELKYEDRTGWNAFGFDKVLDSKHIRDALYEIPNSYEKLTDFIEREFKRYFNDPTVKVGRKNEPYTLQSVSDAMGSNVRGREQVFAKGLGYQRSKLTKNLDLEGARRESGRLVDQEEFQVWKEAQDRDWDEFVSVTNTAADGQEYRWRGFEALDDLAGMVGRLAKGQVTEARAARLLQGAGLDPSGEHIEAMVRLAEGLKSAPTEYFEAKPLRPVRNHEWAGVVVPKGTSGVDIDAIRAAGFRDVKVYDPEIPGDREVKIHEMAIEDGDVLFQKADKDRPWYVLRSEQAVEKLMKGPMPAGSLRAMLLNAGVKADELKWTGLDELMEGGGKVTPDEVRARLAEGRVRLEEVRFGGDKDAAAIADWQRRYNEVEEAYRNASGEKANPILYKNLGEAVRNDIGKLIDVVDREGVELSLEGTSAVLKVEETWSTRKRVIQRKIPDVQWNWIRKMAPAEQKVALANLLQSDWEFNVDRIVRDMEASDVSGKDIPVYVRMQGEVKQAWEAIAEKAKKVEDLRQARSDLQMVQFERNQDPRYNAYRASKGATETYEIEEYSEDPELEYHIFNSEGEYITTAFDKDYAMEELDRLDSEAGEGHYISEEYGDPQIRYDIVNEYGDSMEAHWSREEAEAALEKYQGGRDNYREFLIQWPEGPGINQPHWGRAHVNTLMHVRTSDLPIDWALGGEYNPFLPKGDQALVIEEIQSDWHQKGRDAGYRGPVKVVDVEQVDRNDPYLVGRFQHVDENTAVVKAKVEFGGRLVDGYYTVHKDWVDQPRMMESLIAEQFMRTNNYYEAAPQAPFEKTWHEVGLKRAIRMAAEEGYGEMLWPAGKEHAALYNQVLADNLDQVVVQESTRTGLIEVMGMKGGAPVTRKEVTESELPGMIGGKMAKEAMEQIRAGKRAEFSGDNLTIGGKGMEGFYDQMLPAAAKKLVRKFGSDVERVTIGEKDFWRVPVTDEMRASVMDEGLVLFQKKPIRDPLNRPVGEKPDWKRAAADVARTVKHSTEKAAAALGNPLDKLRNAGREGSVARMAGQQLATDTERVLNLSSAHTLKLLDAIDQTVKKELGPLYRQLPSKRAALNAVAEKAVRGEWGRFTDQEKRIWGAWVDVNRALIDEAQARGVMVDRVVDRFVPPQLRGERIWFFDRTGETPRETEGVVTGIVTDGRGNSVAIDVRMPGGEIRRLNQWERFSSRQLVAPERFFPRQLKDDVYDLLQSGPIEGQTGQDAERYERLMEAVQRSVGAKDRAEAERIRAEIFDPRREIKAVTGGVARLERPRIPFELDPEFYNTDFYEVVSGHVGAAVKRLTMAKVWGQDGWRFAELAGKLGNETDELAGEVKVALGDRGMLSESTRMIRTLARLEGAWQALSKLTGIGTAIVQIGQTAAPAGLFGSKAYLQGWGKYLEGVLDKVKGQVGEIDRVRLSGAIENSVLELSTVNGPADVAQKLADIGLTVTGVKPVDTFFRYHAAMVGRIAAEDAVRRLKVVNGKVVRDAQFRLLNDWMLLDEAAVNRLAETRTLTDDDLVMAYQAGSKTQIRNRTADLPAAVSRNPLMSVMMRFQQFNYGQVKILGWAAKEAAKGNVAPLARMTVAYAAAGWVTTQLKNKVLAWIERKEERPVPEGLLNELIFYTTKGGMYGMFSRLYEGQVEPDMADASSAQRSSRFAQDVQRSLVPPIVSDAAINPMAAKAYADKTGGGLKDFLDEWARRSIVVYGRASRRNEPDYWYIDRMRREMRDELNAQGYKPGDVQWYLDALYPVPAPRGATEEYRTYRENYETLVKMGYTPAQARKELGPAPDKFAGDRGAEPEDVPEPDREIEDRIQKDLAAAAQRGGR